MTTEHRPDFVNTTTHDRTDSPYGPHAHKELTPKVGYVNPSKGGNDDAVLISAAAEHHDFRKHHPDSPNWGHQGDSHPKEMTTDHRPDFVSSMTHDRTDNPYGPHAHKEVTPKVGFMNPSLKGGDDDVVLISAEHHDSRKHPDYPWAHQGDSHPNQYFTTHPATADDYDACSVHPYKDAEEVHMADADHLAKMRKPFHVGEGSPVKEGDSAEGSFDIEKSSTRTLNNDSPRASSPASLAEKKWDLIEAVERFEEAEQELHDMTQETMREAIEEIRKVSD
jgi:hypothetical protein